MSSAKAAYRIKAAEDRRIFMSAAWFSTEERLLLQMRNVYRTRGPLVAMSGCDTVCRRYRCLFLPRILTPSHPGHDRPQEPFVPCPGDLCLEFLSAPPGACISLLAQAQLNLQVTIANAPRWCLLVHQPQRLALSPLILSALCAMAAVSHRSGSLAPGQGSRSSTVSISALIWVYIAGEAASICAALCMYGPGTSSSLQ